jgi:hypothetical protein
MTKDDDLVKRLRDRAKQERLIQANNEAVAAALMGQRLLFDQGHRSPSNTYAVRLSLDHEKCAKQDAELAADWDEAADRIEALEAKLAKAVERLTAMRDDRVGYRHVSHYRRGATVMLAEIEGDNP